MQKSHPGEPGESDKQVKNTGASPEAFGGTGDVRSFTIHGRHGGRPSSIKAEASFGVSDPMGMKKADSPESGSNPPAAAKGFASLLARAFRSLARNQNKKTGDWLSAENAPTARKAAAPAETGTVPSGDPVSDVENKNARRRPLIVLLSPVRPEATASPRPPPPFSPPVGSRAASTPAPVPRTGTKPVTKKMTVGQPFWPRVRKWAVKQELRHPFRFWCIVLLLIAGFLAMFFVAGNTLTNPEFFKKADRGNPLAAPVSQDVPLAPIETTIDAMEKITRGNIPEARELLTSHNPPVPAARYLLAISDYFSGNVIRAAAALETPGGDNSSRSSEQALLAWVAMAGKSSKFLFSAGSDDPEALKHIRASLRADPTNAFAYMLLGLWQRRNNQPDEALRTLDAIRVITGTSGSEIEVGILRAVARVGAAATREDSLAAVSREGVAEIAASAARQARWGDRNKAIQELQKLSSLVGMTPVTLLLADPIFQQLSLTQKEIGSLAQPIYPPANATKEQ